MSEETISADPLPENSETIGNWFRYLKVTCKQSDIVVFRFLLSKLLYTQEFFTEEDEVLLFTSFEKVTEKCACDPSFKERYFWLLFLTRNVFKNLGAFAADLESRSMFAKQLESSFSKGRKLLDGCIYYGMKIEATVRMQAGYPKKPKAKNRIAVGYRDKGNAKKVAWDGSPSWQEVATDEWFQLQNHSVSLGSKIEQMYFDLKVGEHYRWQTASAPRKTSKLAREMRG